MNVAVTAAALLSILHCACGGILGGAAGVRLLQRSLQRDGFSRLPASFNPAQAFPAPLDHQGSTATGAFGGENCDPVHFPALNVTGLIAVAHFLVQPGTSPNAGTVDDAIAVRAAMQAAADCGAAGVFFPSTARPHGYQFNSTVVVTHDRLTGSPTLLFQGGGPTFSQFVTPSQASIRGSPTLAGPCFLLQETQRVRFANLNIRAPVTAMYVYNSPLVQLDNCLLGADTNVDGGSLTPAACDHCNVRLGSNNTALVVVNSYWLWITDCEFSFLAGQGQRPSVILRGQSPSSSDGLTDQVYLVRMERINFAGGGVQYQQVANGNTLELAAFFEFAGITFEQSASPLLDVQVAPSVTSFTGLSSLSIIDCSWTDSVDFRYMRKYPKIPQNDAQAVGAVLLNCTADPTRQCGLHGLTAISVSCAEMITTPCPAVRVVQGQVDGATMLGSYGRYTAGAHTVLDCNNTPVGSWVARREDGFELVGRPNSDDSNASSLTGCSGTHNEGAGPGHALLLGLEHETNARMAIDLDGTIRWGDGSADFDTAMYRKRSVSILYDPPLLAAGASGKVLVDVAGARTSDVVGVSHEHTGMNMLSWGAHVAMDGQAMVVIRNNEPEVEVDLAEGRLTLVVSSFAGPPS